MEYLARQKGWQITMADNGEEAIAIYRENSFDIIIMDVQMPILRWIQSTKS